MNITLFGVFLSFCDRLAVAMLHFLWQSVVIAVCLAAASILLRRSTARARYIANVLALCLLSVCIPATLYFLPAAAPVDEPVGATPSFVESAGIADGDFTDFAVADAATIPARMAPLMISEVVPAEPVLQNPGSDATAASLPGPVGELSSGFAGGRSEFSATTYRRFVVVAWMTGVVLMLLRMGRGIWKGQQLRGASQIITDARLSKLAVAQAAALGMKVTPALRYCERLTVPMVVGLMNPIVLLPLSFLTGLESEQLRAILRHEFAHIYRMDHWVHLFQYAAESVLFFHPVVWWVSHRVSVEREICCDDIVVATGCEGVEYAGALIRAAELFSEGRGGGMLPQVTALRASGSSSSQFNQRVRRLLGEADFGPSVGIQSFALMSTFLLVVAVSVAALSQSSAKLLGQETKTGASVARLEGDERGSKVEGRVYVNEQKGNWDTDESAFFEPDPHQPGEATRVQGFVSQIVDNFAQITVGSDDGLKAGTKLSVSRGKTLLGVIEVVTLTPDESMCRITQTDEATPVRRGDSVAVVGPYDASVSDDNQSSPGPLCRIPFPQLSRPTGWSDVRYSAFLLSSKSFHAAMKIDSSLSARLSSVYESAEAKNRVVASSEGDPVEWSEVVIEMHGLLSELMLERSRQLSRQQMGLNLLLSEDPEVVSALKLSAQQNFEIRASITAYEQNIAGLNHHLGQFPSPAKSDPTPHELPGISIAAAKQSWLRYWMERQCESQIAAILRPEQSASLNWLLGDGAARVASWNELFDREVLEHHVELMPALSRRTKLIHLNPPKADDVVAHWIADNKLDRSNVPPRDSVFVVSHKLVDHVESRNSVAYLGYGQLHVAIYACTLYRKDVVQPLAVVYRHIARFYPDLKDAP